MQARFNALNADAFALSSLTGIEYTLEYHTEPSFFLIRKNKRTYAKIELVSMYYVVQGTIYQAPNITALVENRLVVAVDHLKAALDIMMDEYDFHPLTGYSWKEDRKSIENNEDVNEDRDLKSSEKIKDMEIKMDLDAMEVDHEREPSKEPIPLKQEMPCKSALQAQSQYEFSMGVEQLINDVFK